MIVNGTTRTTDQSPSYTAANCVESEHYSPVKDEIIEIARDLSISREMTVVAESVVGVEPEGRSRG